MSAITSSTSLRTIIRRFAMRFVAIASARRLPSPTSALVALGAVTRTGFETMVEYSHRLVTGIEGLLILGLSITAFPLRRRYPETPALHVSPGSSVSRSEAVVFAPDS